jgi:LPS O-antigen subunit length determinant protein (WzzB/FepE family)
VPLEPIEDEIVIDGARLITLLLTHWKRLALGAALTALIFFLYRSFFSPQQYVATASVAVQQPGGTITGPLGGLFGQSTSKRYVGVLKSRSLADQIIQELGLRQSLGITQDRQLYEALMKGIKPRDDADGLLYIEITLGGPPRFGPDPKGLRKRLPQVVADIANAYAEHLHRYYVENDNERDTVLQRSAAEEERRARRDYTAAVSRLRRAQSRYRNADPREVPSSAVSSTGSAQDGLTELPALFAALNIVESDIRQLETTLKAQGVRTDELLSNLNTLPAEDPLLTTERNRYQEELLRLRNLEVRLGPAAVEVVVQRARVGIAKGVLDAAVKAVRSRQTTDVVKELTRLEGLQSRREVLEQQIRRATQFLRNRLDRSSTMEDLRTEVLLKFEALKIAITETARLRVSTVSAVSKVVPIDRAIPPFGGEPGMSRYILEACFVSLITPFVMLVFAYMRSVRVNSGA